MMWERSLITFVFALIARASADFEDRCLGFEPQHQVNESTLNVLEYVPAGSNVTFSDNDPTCNRGSQVVNVALCRVALSVPTTNRSGIVYELWLPEEWNGRTLATGNGGIDGCVKYEDIAYGAANGFARYSFGTNNGHNGTTGEAFYRNENVVIDYAWRALHVSVQVGRALATTFYKSDLGKSYYIGCSLGGRQGIGSAEMFPEDFDGIVAGAPAVDFDDLYSWRASFYTVTGAVGSPDFISPDTWKTTIHNEILGQCDLIDGVADGIIEDPALCHWDPESLLCDSSGRNTTGCLSSIQVEMVKTIFSDYFWPDGTLLYPRMNPGSEILAADGLYSGKPYSPSADWFRFVVLEDPSWNPANYSKKDAMIAARKNPANIRTWPSRLTPFQNRGGKIISYHGQQDQQISSLNSLRYWKHLLGGMHGDAERLAEFHRLFRIPGMNHCTGGPGAWTIGQGGSAPAYAIPFDGLHNVLAAVVDWVEKDAAPEHLIGTKFANDSVAAGIMYQHRHCRFPYRSTYRQSGDPSEMNNWDCVDSRLDFF
ncbi:tannase and feruloyl esterase [Xylariaceae sp. FL1272]|nr:tannase and feruloyl esterase [Xylariaceae sp. FL1272]